MSQTLTIEALEERVATLERELRELRELLKLPGRKKDPRRTFGMFKNDPVFAEIVELGRRWRQEQNQRSLETESLHESSEAYGGTVMTTPNDLEQRVATLERKVADFERLIKRPKKEKDWRATVGMFKDDPYFEEIVELGRQWREEENRKSLEELE